MTGRIPVIFMKRMRDRVSSGDPEVDPTINSSYAKMWPRCAGGWAPDVAAVRGWLIETGRIHADAVITHIEIRGWKPID